MLGWWSQLPVVYVSLFICVRVAVRLSFIQALTAALKPLTSLSLWSSSDIKGTVYPLPEKVLEPPTKSIKPPSVTLYPDTRAAKFSLMGIFIKASKLSEVSASCPCEKSSSAPA